MKKKIYAVIRFQFEALHHWPNPTNGEDHLKSPHRHIFHVTVRVEQFHNERDVEYLELKRILQRIFGPVDGTLKNLGPKSCETIATEIAEYIQERYKRIDATEDCERQIAVEVSEDGENGAVITLT